MSFYEVSSDDIVPLLRNAVEAWANDAADEIERLRAHNIALSETSVGELFDEIERLRAAGDALAVAYRTLGGLDVAHDAALVNWEARRER